MSHLWQLLRAARAETLLLAVYLHCGSILHTKTLNLSFKPIKCMLFNIYSIQRLKIAPPVFYKVLTQPFCDTAVFFSSDNCMPSCKTVTQQRDNLLIYLAFDLAQYLVQQVADANHPATAFGSIMLSTFNMLFRSFLLLVFLAFMKYNRKVLSHTLTYQEGKQQLH